MTNRPTDEMEKVRQQVADEVAKADRHTVVDISTSQLRDKFNIAKNTAAKYLRMAGLIWNGLHWIKK